MFRGGSKTNTEKALDRAHDQLLQAAQLSAAATEQLREKVAPAVAQAALAATTAKELAQPRMGRPRGSGPSRTSSTASSWRLPRWTPPSRASCPRWTRRATRSSRTVLPRLTAALTTAAAASAAAREEALAVGHEAAVRGAGAKMVLTGEAVAKQKRSLDRGTVGKVGLIVAIVAALGAAAAYFVKKSAPKEDPSATPLQEPYVAPAAPVGASPAATAGGRRRRGDPRRPARRPSPRRTASEQASPASRAETDRVRARSRTDCGP